MIGTWLHSLLRTPCSYKKFDLFDVDEHQQLTPQIEQYLQKLLIEARLKKDMLKEAAEELGWDRVNEILVEPTQPKQQKKRSGDFGEVLTNALMVEMYNYIIPVQKLQFAISDEQSQPGTDIIALKKTGDSISEVCYVESKLRTKNDIYSVQAAVEGYKQLKADYAAKVPNMISFVLARLYDDNKPLFKEFLNYVNKRQDLASIDRFRIGLVWEHTKWQENVLELLDEEVDSHTPKLVVHRVRIQNLSQIVTKLYDSMGMEVLEDE